MVRRFMWRSRCSSSGRGSEALNEQQLKRPRSCVVLPLDRGAAQRLLAQPRPHAFDSADCERGNRALFSLGAAAATAAAALTTVSSLDGECSRCKLKPLQRPPAARGQHYQRPGRRGRTGQRRVTEGIGRAGGSVSIAPSQEQGARVRRPEQERRRLQQRRVEPLEEGDVSGKDAVHGGRLQLQRTCDWPGSRRHRVFRAGRGGRRRARARSGSSCRGDGRRRAVLPEVRCSRPAERGSRVRRPHQRRRPQRAPQAAVQLRESALSRKIGGRAWVAVRDDDAARRRGRCRLPGGRLGCEHEPGEACGGAGGTASEEPSGLDGRTGAKGIQARAACPASASD